MSHIDFRGQPRSIWPEFHQLCYVSGVPYVVGTVADVWDHLLHTLSVHSLLVVWDSSTQLLIDGPGAKVKVESLPLEASNKAELV